MPEQLVRPAPRPQPLVRSSGVTPVIVGTTGGPKGDPGDGGGGSAGTVLTVSAAAATWTLSVPNTFGRVPSVAVYLTGGQLIAADVQASSSTVTVTHATPLAGFVVLT